MFVVVLMLVSQRAKVEIVRLLGTQEMKRNLETYLARQRGAASTPLEGIVMLYIFGFIWKRVTSVFRDNFDPYLIAEDLFAVTNVFNVLKFVHFINPETRPLQISPRQICQRHYLRI
ncbi:Transient-receptor-potential-like protein [Ooceraea biroi]|uniref:Transient-receptor-potential-like protein n=1 Tax=Ooceraea biroi TaxID=2015173 RepID=A0A026W4W4_OOCBI|nr:Transient-receptor-potential-like protein [Ooceraea biroi]